MISVSDPVRTEPRISVSGFRLVLAELRLGSGAAACTTSSPVAGVQIQFRSGPIKVIEAPFSVNSMRSIGNRAGAISWPSCLLRAWATASWSNALLRFPACASTTTNSRQPSASSLRYQKQLLPANQCGSILPLKTRCPASRRSRCCGSEESS